MFIEELKTRMTPMTIQPHARDFRKRQVYLKGAGVCFIGTEQQCVIYIDENSFKYAPGYDRLLGAARF